MLKNIYSRNPRSPEYQRQIEKNREEWLKEERRKNSMVEQFKPCNISTTENTLTRNGVTYTNYYNI